MKPSHFPIVALVALAIAAPKVQAQALSPTDTQYEILQIAPIEGIKNGDKPLGLRYRTHHIDDLAIVAEEAADLMSRLLVEAERGNYKTVMISALGPESGGVVSKFASFNSGFERGASGEWVAMKSPANHPGLATALAAAYRAGDVAFKAPDHKGLRPVFAPGWIHYLADGTHRTLEQDLQLLDANVKSLSSWQTSMHGFFVHKERVFVVETQIWSGEIWDAQRVVHKVKDTSRGLDVWQVQGSGVQLTGSQDLEEKMEPG